MQVRSTLKQKAEVHFKLVFLILVDDPDSSPVGSPEPEAPESSSSAGGNERRRSERVKREKPDYYDALEFEQKRHKSPGRPRRDKGPGAWDRPSPKEKGEGREPGAGRGRGRGGDGGSSASGRAMLTWKKGKKGETSIFPVFKLQDFERILYGSITIFRSGGR